MKTLNHTKLLLFIFLLITGDSFSAVIKLRDPTEPPMGVNLKSKEKAQTGVTVTSIIISPRRRIALINGKYVKAGDLVAGNKVITIRRDYVLLSQSGKKFKVYVIKNEVQKKRR